MIRTEEALHTLLLHTHRMQAQILPLHACAGLVCAESINSGIDLPPFDQSAMDGYALCMKDHTTGQAFQIIGELPAGSQTSITLQPGQAFRVYTGSAVPEGTDTVVMQEHVTVNGDELIFSKDIPAMGANIRLQGSHVRTGDQLASDGQTITPALAGLLASAGLWQLPVIPTPKVAIIVTGNELQQPGSPLTKGKIYESNGVMLAHAVSRWGISPTLFRCEDNLSELTNQIDEAASSHDLILLTGGASVGDYDFVMPALNQAGFTTLFHNVLQKPGKPFGSAHRNGIMALALPGNPASVLTCFYVYAAPVIHKMMGYSGPPFSYTHAKLTSEYRKKSGMTHFLKALYSPPEVHLSKGQESYRLDGFALADCLAIIPEATSVVPVGTTVQLLLTDQLIRR